MHRNVHLPLFLPFLVSCFFHVSSSRLPLHSSQRHDTLHILRNFHLHAPTSILFLASNTNFLSWFINFLVDIFSFPFCFRFSYRLSSAWLDLNPSSHTFCFIPLVQYRIADAVGLISFRVSYRFSLATHLSGGQTQQSIVTGTTTAVIGSQA